MSFVGLTGRTPGARRHAAVRGWFLGPRGASAILILCVTLAGCGAGESPESLPPSGGAATGGHESPLRNDRRAWDGRLDMTSREYGDSCLSSGCHAQLVQTRWVHGPTAIGACSACHLSEGAREEHRFVTGEPEQGLCLSCHPPETSAVSVHDPYGSLDCLECHDPHGGAGKNLIKAANTGELCAKCHTLEQVAAPHRPVADGDCTSCHAPHTSRHEHLLSRGQGELCSGCHAEFRKLRPGTIGEELTLAQVHLPLLEEGCTPCHHAHGTDHPALLPGSVSETCRRCHEAIFPKPGTALTIHEVIEGDDSCTQCHTPHASKYDSLLLDRADQLCFRCHDTPILEDSGRVIPDMKDQIAESRHVHTPIAHGDCSVCHLGHSSPQRSLLRHGYPDSIYATFEDGVYGLCFECHDSAMVEREYYTDTWFRDGDRNLHYVHVHRDKGRACDICHESHGSRRDHLIRETFPFGPKGWPMPIGYTHVDGGGSCSSACHELKSYDNGAAGGK